MGYRFNSGRYPFRLAWRSMIQCDRTAKCLRSEHSCMMVDTKKMPDGLIEEIGPLYVGVTCVRKAVYVSASM